MRLKNRLNILLHTVSACYTHFSDDYLLILMTIYNFICLYNILRHLEEHSARLVNFRYIVVYIFYRLQSILDVYLEIYSCFNEMKSNKGLGHSKLFKATLSIDGTIIRNKCVKNYTVPQTCNQNVIQKSKFIENNPNMLHC